MNVRQFSVIAILVFVAVAMSFVAVPKNTTSADSPSYHNVVGWAWSDNIGWLSFSCDNENTCGGVDYGVDMDQDGELSGYAWSSNIGWVTFNRNDLGGCSSPPCKAKVIPGTGEMTGWVKALSADGNGWDGWISLSGSGTYTQDPVWYGAYSYRKKITIDKTKIPSSQTNFPVLVSLIDNDLKNHARTDGADIVFTSSDGITKLSHEIENYNNSTGNLTAWVNAPSLSSLSNTELYMYYGGSVVIENPSGVWGDYEGVWHMNQNPNLGEEIADSAGGNDGTPTNMTAGVPSFDSVTSGTFSSVSSATLNHTLGSGSNRMLIITTGHEAQPVVNVTGISINGSANVGTLVGKINLGTSPWDEQVEMWRIMENDLPASGSISVKVDFSGAANPGISAMSFSGVAQQAEEAEGSATCLNCSSVSKTITTLSDNSLIISAVGNGHTGDYPSHGSGQTEKWDIVPVSAVFAGTIETKTTAGADTQSHNASVVANRQAMYTAAFAPAVVNLQVDGKINKAISFDGVDDYVDTGNASSLQIDNGTISAWIKTANPGSLYRGIISKVDTYGMFLNGGEFGMYDWGAGVWRGSGDNLNNNAWHYVTCSFQSGVAGGSLCYVDGALGLTTSMTVVNQINPVHIGENRAGGGQNFNGTIDETRVSASIKSANWILTEYNNQSSPSTFYSVSPEENYPGQSQVSYTYGPLLNNSDINNRIFEGYAFGSDTVGWLKFDAYTGYEVRLSGLSCNNNGVCEAGLGEDIASCLADCGADDFSLQKSGNARIITVKENESSSDIVTVSVVPTGAFSEDISLSAYSISPTITGATYIFNGTRCVLQEICVVVASSAYASGAQFSIIIPSGVNEGVYTITVAGTASGLTRTVEIPLVIGSLDPQFKEF